MNPGPLRLAATLADPWRRVQAACLLVPLCLALCVASVRFALEALLRHDRSEIDGQILYQAGTLAFNYFQFGAVRRGLGGSIAHLLSPDPLVATPAFHIVCAVAVAGVAAWLFVASRPHHPSAGVSRWRCSP